MTNLVSILNHYARKYPQRLAFLYQEEEQFEELNYYDLNKRARAIAAYLQIQQLEGKQILLLYPAGFDFICAFMGCLYAGAVAVPVPCSFGDEFNKTIDLIRSIAEDAEASCILTSSLFQKKIADYFAKNPLNYPIAVENTKSFDLVAENNYQQPEIGDETIAYLQYTSGSTTTPKGVIVKHKNLNHSLKYITKTSNYSKHSKTLTWAPHSHVYGLICGLLVPLYHGTPSIILSTAAFIRRPLFWLEIITKYQVTHSGGPNFGYELCIESIKSSDLNRLNLKSWRVALNGGEPVQSETLNKFAKKFESCGFHLKHFCPAYGMSETTGSIAMNRLDRKPLVFNLEVESLKNQEAKIAKSNVPECKIVSSGRLLPGLTAVIMEVETLKPLKNGWIGEIWLAGKSIVDGYWQKEKLNEEVFVKLPTSQLTYLRTGDLGFISHNELCITGRLKEINRVNEKNDNPLVTDNINQNKNLIPNSITKSDDIAIIGMNGIFPGSGDIHTFWDNQIERKDCIREIPKTRWNWEDYCGDTSEENKAKVKWGGFIDGVDEFDATFFGISPREAELIDPQQRLFLQVAWGAIEDAGYSTVALGKMKTGMFVGVFNNDYAEIIHKNHITDAYVTTGISHSMLANRASYLLNLQGPSVAIDTACSSSLVAIHHAIKAIHNKDCEVAIVGGANTLLSPTSFITASNAGMLSEDGHCKTFDKNANGFVRAEGVMAIVLKPLAKAQMDGDHIYGVIKGTAVNHGGQVSSLTAPNPNAQAEVITEAIKRANISPETISYIETHGTGTLTGDSNEINGLKKAFSEFSEYNSGLNTYCGLGSVKTHIGHLESAAGLAGVIKVLLSMRHQIIPANLHFKELNPDIYLKGSPFYIINENKPWQRLKDNNGNEFPLRAGVSAFGFGGTNAHVIIEEYHSPLKKETQTEQSSYLFSLSAKTEKALKMRLSDLFNSLKKLAPKPNLAALSYTLNAGRNHFDMRCIIVADTLDELIETLSKIQNGVTPENYLINLSKSNLGNMKHIIENSLKSVKESLKNSDFLPKEEFRNNLLILGNLYIQGCDIDWEILYKGMNERISLPTYPFAKEKHWVPEKISTVSKDDQVIESMAKGNPKKINQTDSLSEIEFDVVKFAISPMDLYRYPDTDFLETFITKQDEIIDTKQNVFIHQEKNINFNSIDAYSLTSSYEKHTQIDWKNSSFDMSIYPWQQKAYWSELFEETDKGQYPLHGKLIKSPLETLQFEFKIESKLIPDLQDTNNILSAGYYLEMLAFVAKQLTNDVQFRVENYQFLSPLIVPNNTCVIMQLVLIKQNNEFLYSFYSNIPDQTNWVEHARGKMYFSVFRETIDSIATIKSRCLKEESADQLYERIIAMGMTAGESTRWTNRYWLNDKEILCEFQQPKFTEKNSSFTLGIHPSFVDGCIQPLFKLLPQELMKPYIAEGASRMTYFGLREGPFYLLGKLKYISENGERIYGDCYLINSNSDLIATFEEICFTQFDEKIQIQESMQTSDIVDSYV